VRPVSTVGRGQDADDFTQHAAVDPEPNPVPN
jgi:hypothetical protein